MLLECARHGALSSNRHGGPLRAPSIAPLIRYGSIYKGGFAEGVCFGVGVWYYADGATYSGPMVDGFRHGTGVYRSADGAKYEGEWARGLRSGQGRDVSADGLSEYQGEWPRMHTDYMLRVQAESAC
mgnify:CR=1 FL=1